MRVLAITLGSVAAAALATDFVIRRHPVTFSTTGSPSPGWLVPANDRGAVLYKARLWRSVAAPLALSGVFVLAMFAIASNVAAIAEGAVAAIGSPDPVRTISIAISEKGSLFCAPALAAAVTASTAFAASAIGLPAVERVRRMAIRIIAGTAWLCAAAAAIAIRFI
jgi:hypothetical protein